MALPISNNVPDSNTHTHKGLAVHNNPFQIYLILAGNVFAIHEMYNIKERILAIFVRVTSVRDTNLPI